MNVKALAGTIAGLAVVTGIDIVAFYLVASFVAHNLDTILTVWSMVAQIVLHQF